MSTAVLMQKYCDLKVADIYIAARDRSTMRKGISLSIETIIVLMLALVVLVVLLGMLFNVAPPVQNDLQARTKQIQACGAYTNYDGDCSLGTDYTTFKSSNSAVLK